MKMININFILILISLFSIKALSSEMFKSHYMLSFSCPNIYVCDFDFRETNVASTNKSDLEEVMNNCYYYEGNIEFVIQSENLIGCRFRQRTIFVGGDIISRDVVYSKVETGILYIVDSSPTNNFIFYTYLKGYKSL